ncbi:phenylalanine--tRNA ligase subunit beta [Candidatus Nomurabacteria bacterium]|nr:phenylalanine--tRNA ligase subunit beta [Candidatus Nomurabacteria bacterium]
MLVSYNWLNKYFDNTLPEPEKVGEALTFYAWEIDGIEKVDDDTVFDVKVLPDKAMWGLSHRGIAKDLSVILKMPLKSDPLKTEPELLPASDLVKIKVESKSCRRFAGALVKDVKVGPSPKWLKDALEALGQRSINNIVDASNYVMFDIGQPSHTFDASVVGEGVLVRQAEKGEVLKALDETEYAFTEEDTVIATLSDKRALSIAGIKGGMESGISEATTDIFVETANWDPITTRKTASRLKLRSDASARYENGIVPEMVPYGLKAVVDLILEIAGGELVGYSEVGNISSKQASVTVSLEKINNVLGLSLIESDVTSVMDRFGWEYKVNGEEFVITSPFERTDLNIAEDVIEEIGRIYGYEHVTAIIPEPIAQTEINQRFYYSEVIRDVLIKKGFSEIFTSSFRSEDKVKLANAFASDKGYLRGDLKTNIKEALTKNAPYTDLLGMRQVRIFEIGTVFTETGEELLLALGVQSPSGYKAKSDDLIVTDAIKGLSDALGVELTASATEAVVEIKLGELLTKLPEVQSYKKLEPEPVFTYKPFSSYPAITRDIAMWVDESVSVNEIEELLNEKAGPLRVRTTLFDEFKKDDKVSYAFRLVFQSSEKTLTDDEINVVMEVVYDAIKERGFEVR